MPGYGFCRVEVYARKSRSGKNSFRTVSEVLDEAERLPGNMPHVKQPRPPKVIAGCSFEELRQRHDAVGNATQTQKNRRKRKIRSTQNTLATAILSYPIAVASLRKAGKEEQALYYAWRKDAVAFMQAEWGDDFTCAVEHLDEKFPHLHCYAVRANFEAKENHPGFRAQKEALADGKSAREAEIAGALALKDFLNRYHEHVGQHYGMERFGPKRERLSRKAWVKRQIAADDHAKRVRDRTAYCDAIRAEIAAEWAQTSTLGKITVAKAVVQANAVQKAVTKQVETFKHRYTGQFENAEKAVNTARVERDAVRKNLAEEEAVNRELIDEIRMYRSAACAYDQRMAQMEVVMTHTIHGLHDVAQKTSSETAYQHLSHACEVVQAVHEEDANVFVALAREVRSICRAVPRIFQRLFAWTPENKHKVEQKQRERQNNHVITPEASNASSTPLKL